MFDWKELLDFWFGKLDEHGLPDADHRNRWFRSDRKFDQEIRRRFLSLVLFASEQGLEHWRNEAGGALAEILLLDQFTRNIFRGGALAFESDRLARHLSRQAMDRGQDLELPLIQRAFLYMPMQHSELKKDQDLSVACYEQLVASADGLLAEFLGSFLQSAVDHRDIVLQFGRFPHRNKALGRTSTEAEQAYLAGGRRFGQ
ncbi:MULTISPECIES: DUF924 family protein [Marinobacter]|jgi:uncharacterized protein (DUF924 family)|uniref:DUF924 domain-containing protein n=2 Tax=Marinobacter TaxID=2742 RepID=A0A1M2UY41_MARNT|nr:MULTISPECIES: DUF924 family protein [Marinobacter]OJT00274.1 hypothetical protein BEE62_09385 [Marinobacter nauticus]QFS87276.1 hypothetical protein FIV08_10580 [Marinobacter sp. THAF197a]QFT51060.1 hypothetical protein FIU96_10500 [Marinobacter sp. THAF39]